MTVSPVRPASLPALALAALALAACGGSTPPPKTEEPVVEQPARESRGPTIEQELGSIDPGAVEKKFADLGENFEACHTKGRARVDYLAGDVKVFLRIGKDGKVRYGWLEESTLGDRDTEKCVLDVLFAADWPRPEGGEAEVRNGFGWPGGDERPPTSWGAEKVLSALEAAKDVRKAVNKCKAGVSGDFTVTAYVEPGEAPGDGDDAPAVAAKPGKHGKHGKHGKPASAGPKAGKRDKGENHGGRFQAIGVAAPSKGGAEKVECLVDALKKLPLPSPGSYAAKVTFTP